MANGLDLTKIKAYEAYVQKYSKEIVKVALEGFATAPYLKAEGDISGKKTWTVLNSLGRVLKPFTGTYAAVPVMEKIPRTLAVELMTAEMDIHPDDILRSYEGEYILPDLKILPDYIQNILGFFLENKMTDIDEVLWKGDVALTGIMGTTDGYDKQIKEAITNAMLSPVATGAITSENVIESFEAVYDELKTNVKKRPLFLYTSEKNKTYYARQYKKDTTKYTNAGKVMTMLFGTSCEIVGVPAWEGTSRVAVAESGNFRYGYNGALNSPLFIKPDHYKIEHSSVNQLGALIMKPWDGQLSVNDQF